MALQAGLSGAVIEQLEMSRIHLAETVGLCNSFGLCV